MTYGGKFDARMCIFVSRPPTHQSEIMFDPPIARSRASCILPFEPLSPMSPWKREGASIRLHRAVDWCPFKASSWPCHSFDHVDLCFLGNTESCSTAKRDGSGATARWVTVAPSLANRPSSEDVRGRRGASEGCNCWRVCRGSGRHVLCSSTSSVVSTPNRTDLAGTISPKTSVSRRGGVSPPSPPPPPILPFPAEDLSHFPKLLVVTCRYRRCSWSCLFARRFFASFIFVSCFVTKLHTSGASEASKHVHVRRPHLLRVQHGHHSEAKAWEGPAVEV